MWTAPLEYMQIHVYYNPHTDTRTRTRVNVNAPLADLWTKPTDEPVACLYRQPVNRIHHGHYTDSDGCWSHYWKLFPLSWGNITVHRRTATMICFVIPHSNTKKYEYTANNQRANNDVMDSRCIIMIYLLFGLARDNQISFGNKCFWMQLGIFIKLGINLFHKNYSIFWWEIYVRSKKLWFRCVSRVVPTVV